MRVLILVVLLALPAAAEEGIHGSVSAGLGLAYAGLGARAELRLRPFAPFGALGAFPNIGDDQAEAWSGGFSAGARGYFRDLGRGPFLQALVAASVKHPD